MKNQFLEVRDNNMLMENCKLIFNRKMYTLVLSTFCMKKKNV